MELSKQVILLEQAKKLKELGVMGQSIATYFTTSIDPENPMLLYTAQELGQCDYPAYTVAELGVMLPMGIDGHGRQIINRTYENAHRVYYEESAGVICGYESCNEAEARADMLIWLLENSHVKSNDVNARLAA